PRTREGCDATSLANWLSSLDISIHAPVKGATTMEGGVGGSLRISIHAPVKGATADYPNPSFIIYPKMRQRSKPITTLST
ncbi:MAG: hypothetical protein PHQ81_08070, partial [Methanofollis sp.]|nr:hypothetical protein [Methanofollis sp.]